MEKSKMVVKAEQQQQRDRGGSSSAADELAVTVDPEALDCPICFHPLSPPVFQCAAGHVVCSACRDRLQGSGRCQVCSAATVYGRCHAVERILRSVRVPCPNAARGCGVQTPLARSSASTRATVYSSTPLAPTSRWPTNNPTACCMNKTS